MQGCYCLSRLSTGQFWYQSSQAPLGFSSRNTPTLPFSNDLADVIRIFWGDAEIRVNGSGGDVLVSHTEKTEGRVRFCRIAAEGAFRCLNGCSHGHRTGVH